ncbi:hypothetical protein [Cupriavidus sp. H18C1]|uniref:hypothetical protein n=1 Tax=Cupriavidus sp. H18C1 TaxID=3241601 RepID=UPI003BB913D5
MNAASRYSTGWQSYGGEGLVMADFLGQQRARSQLLRWSVNRLVMTPSSGTRPPPHALDPGLPQERSTVTRTVENMQATTHG